MVVVFIASRVIHMGRGVGKHCSADLTPVKCRLPLTRLADVQRTSKYINSKRVSVFHWPNVLGTIHLHMSLVSWWCSTNWEW